ncbi:DUF2975 domain-containing protein [Flavobacterium zepuense]|uniref:DUF2975 domain-containing protein n=1 Tax=Flavobacterium zepuense TaxID=2593302 RepID=A0A552UXD3_9FLAO|nr:DUF2975 domain-containing protein [Flavobacterium zepuense]TRW22862.1 DUF2975 domain-containing protein [Flavobacterium zepuense]
MKNIRFLNWALIVFMGIYILGIFLSFYLIWDSAIIRNSYKMYGYIGYVNILMGFLFLYGLYQIQRSIAASIESNFFSFKSAIYLKRGGYVLLAYTIIATIKTILLMDVMKTEILISNSSEHGVLFIVSIGLLAVADIIKNGTRIKQENDLTI